ncbi:MAG: hypothetical protein WC861_04040 [Candidatus Micrarchaeia archaeon]|jgi:DNA-binding protein YbaB
MLTFQVEAKPIAFKRNLPEFEVKSNKLQTYNTVAEFRIVEGSKTYLISGKDAKGEKAIKDLNTVLATCEKVKNEINIDPNIEPKDREILIRSITAYQTEVISKVKMFTAKSEFSTSATMPGPRDIYLQLGGKGAGYKPDEDSAAKAFALVKKYPVLEPLTQFSRIGRGELGGSPYITDNTHPQNDLPSKHLDNAAYKTVPRNDDGSEYGKASNYNLNGMSVDYIPAKTVKK